MYENATVGALNQHKVYNNDAFEDNTYENPLEKQESKPKVLSYYSKAVQRILTHTVYTLLLLKLLISFSKFSQTKEI